MGSEWVTRATRETRTRSVTGRSANGRQDVPKPRGKVRACGKRPPYYIPRHAGERDVRPVTLQRVDPEPREAQARTHRSVPLLLPPSPPSGRPHPYSHREDGRGTLESYVRHFNVLGK